MRRRAVALLSVSLALVARATPPDAPSFAGALTAGEEQAFALPTQGKGFWVVSLAGDKDGVDLDLRVATGDRAVGASQGQEAAEVVLVPATLKDLTAVVSHHDGPRTGFTVSAAPLAAGKKLALNKQLDGEVDALGGAFAVHELPASSSKFSLVSLGVTEDAREGVDLDLYVYDEAWKLVAKSQGEAADEQAILSPSRDARWVVVRA